MAAIEAGWRGEIEGHSSILSLLRFMNPPGTRLGDPGNTKVRDFLCYSNYSYGQ